MTFEGILLGLIALAVGAAFTFYGFKFFLILLPLWAFVVGFSAGAQAVSQLFNEGFLTTITGWVVGFFLGAAFAVISYLWYWAAIVLLGGGLGYTIGVGLMGWLNIHGFLAVVVGVILGAVFAVGTILLRAPRVLVVVFTSLGGAATIVGGILLIIGRIPVGSLTDGVLGAVLEDNLFWFVVWVAIAALGVVYQSRMVAATDELDASQWRYA
jgi:hypothetical protein